MFVKKQPQPTKMDCGCDFLSYSCLIKGKRRHDIVELFNALWLLEQPLSADAAANAALLAHSAVQVEVQGQVFACVQLVACFHNGAVALQGGSGSTTAVDGCLRVAAKFILPCQACVSLIMYP